MSRDRNNLHEPYVVIQNDGTSNIRCGNEEFHTRSLVVKPVGDPRSICTSLCRNRVGQLNLRHKIILGSLNNDTCVFKLFVTNSGVKSGDRRVILEDPTKIFMIRVPGGSFYFGLGDYYKCLKDMSILTLNGWVILTKFLFTRLYFRDRMMDRVSSTI